MQFAYMLNCKQVFIACISPTCQLANKFYSTQSIYLLTRQPVFIACISPACKLANKYLWHANHLLVNSSTCIYSTQTIYLLTCKQVFYSKQLVYFLSQSQSTKILKQCVMSPQIQRGISLIVLPLLSERAGERLYETPLYFTVTLLSRMSFSCRRRSL